MEKAIELAIIIISLYYMGLPLLRRQGSEAGLSHSAKRDELHRLLVLKDNAYATIKDLQFDFKTGKISEDDYKDLLAKYEAEAVGILKKIDSCKTSKTSETSRKKKRNSMRQGAE